MYKCIMYHGTHVKTQGQAALGVGSISFEAGSFVTCYIILQTSWLVSSQAFSCLHFLLDIGGLELQGCTTASGSGCVGSG